MKNVNTEELRAQVAELRAKLARMEEALRREDDKAWREFQRERAAAIGQCEKIANLCTSAIRGKD